MNGTAGWYGLTLRGVSVAAGFSVAAALLGGSGAFAQQKKEAPKAAPAAPAAQPAAAQPQSMWVKLCEKAPVMLKNKEGKDVREEKQLCLTHHERLDGNTGMVLVSAAVRQVEGADKAHLMVMVPLGMAIQPGLKAALYTKELWEKVEKNEKPAEKTDDSKFPTINLKFSLCHPAGCTAELELTKEIIDGLRNNAGLVVYAINSNGQIIGFPVPLTGFGGALDGAPIDNAVYTEGRKALMKQLAERQQAIIEEYKKQQAAKQPAAAPAPGTPAAKPAAPAAKPAEKK